jgi:hypothetical protein
MSRRYVFLGLSITFVFGVCYLGWLLLRFVGFGFSPNYSTVEFVYMAIATILGVIASILVSGFRQLDPKSRVKLQQVFDMLLRPGGLIALCVSPVVFYGVLIAAQGQDTGALSMLAAFQNGFFWEQVLKHGHGGSSPPLTAE